VPQPPTPPAADLDVQRLAVVGVGLIGGSAALAAKRAWPSILITGIDRGAALAEARLVPAFDHLSDDLRAARGADLVLLAAPVRQNGELLERLGGVLDAAALVTDVGSTKRETVERSAVLPPHLSFVGGHPLAGAARGGMALARADLFVGRPWILTPGPATRTDGDVKRIEQFVESLGARPRRMAADEHDRLLAFLSHLPQLAGTALMRTVGTASGDQIGLAGPGLVDSTRLASSPVDIWQDICLTNADHIRPALDALIQALSEVRDGLEDAPAIMRMFESAQAWRERLTSAVRHDP
jgi:prephenate dehydrogenase